MSYSSEILVNNDTESWDEFIKPEISNNIDYNPSPVDDNVGLSLEESEPNEIPREELLSFLNNEIYKYDDYAGKTIELTYTYNDYKDPIKYKVEIPHNKIDKEVISVEAEGHLGETVTVDVPKVEGYTTDVSTIEATVNADGRIVAKDGELVTYTKIATNNNNGNHTNNSDGTISGTDLKISTVNDAKIYNQNGREIGKISSKQSDFTITKKMVKDDIVYYQISTNEWIKASNTYVYTDKTGYLRTTSDSYKHLISSSNKVLNRGLAAGSDWKADRIATFNGEKYYRVATDEWIKFDDGGLYEPETTVIKVIATTFIYNDLGQKVRIIDKDVSLKSDRISEINGKQMYRVATNEYILVSDTK